MDAAAVTQLGQRLAEAVDGGATCVTVDLTDVVHVDGPAVRSLLMHSRLLHDRGARLRLARSRRPVRWALRFHGAGHLVAA